MIKKFITLLSGIAGVQLISFLLLPVLTRLYTEELFGEFGIFTSLLAILSIIISLRCEQLILINGEKKREISYSTTLTVIFVVALFLALTLLAVPMSVFADISPYTQSLFYLALLASFGQAVIVASYNYEISIHNYKNATLINVARILAVMTFQFMLWRMGSLNGLIAGNVIGLLLLAFFKAKKLCNWSEYNFVKNCLYFWNNKTFCIYSMPQGVINSISQSLPIFFIGAQFSTSMAGQYFLASKVVQLPVNMFNAAIRPLFLQELTKVREANKSVSQVLIKYTLRLSYISLPIFIILYFSSVKLFSFVFGSNWAGAGNLAGCLCFWLFFNFINPPSTSLIYSLKKVGVLLWFETVLFIVRAVSLYFSINAGMDLYQTVLLFSIASGLMSFSLILISIYISLKYDQK